METSWVLIFLYILLLFTYTWYIPNNRIPSWRPIPHTIHDDDAASRPCSDTAADCPLHHVCLLGTCVPILLRGETCDPSTGSWSVTDVRGKQFAVCTCTYPHLVSQKHFGGNCDVDVACGRHGFYNAANAECECDVGYRSVREPFPTCTKLSAVERIRLYPCEDDEVTTPEDWGFSRGYINAHADKKCFKRPCTFDAFTGRPLKHGRYERGVGCVCDPTMGLFGVRLESNGEYLDGQGYNACASILTKDPDTPLDVDLYAYFYLLDRLPVAFIQFRNVPTRHLLPVFGKRDTIQISQEWPYDYMQYMFRHEVPYTTRTRTSTTSKWLPIMTVDEWSSRSNEMIECRDLSLTLKSGTDTHGNVYRLLYQYPVCHLESWDTEVPEHYRGRYVLNPFHFHLQIIPVLVRSNGVVIRYREGRWKLDLAEPYDMGTYLLDPSYVPDIGDKVIDELEDVLEITGEHTGIFKGTLEHQAQIREYEKWVQRI